MDPQTDNGTTPGTEPAEPTTEQQPQTPPAAKPAAEAQPPEPGPAEDKPRETDPADEPPVSGVHLPDYLPDHVRDDPETQAVVAEAAAVLKEETRLNDVQVQRLVDLVSQFELEAGSDHPPLWQEDTIRGLLKRRWGTVYESRLADMQKYVAARPKLRDWLNKTGAGNYVPVLEALAAVADGTMSLGAADAQRHLDAARKDRKGPLMNAGHPNHHLAVSRARVLADVVDRVEKHAAKKDGGRSEEQAAKRGEEAWKERRGEGSKPTSEQQKLDDEIQKIRTDPQYFKDGPATKVLHERMKELMRLRWPD